MSRPVRFALIAAGLALAFLPLSAAAEERVTKGALVTEAVPEVPAELTAGLLRYQNARSAGFVDWAPDGSMLVATRFGETAQLHKLAAPMGMRRQLTFFAEPVGTAIYRPGATPAQFAFMKDTGGDENFQIFLRNEVNHQDTQVSAPGTRNTGMAWSDDGRYLGWSVSSQENAVYRLVLKDIQAGGETKEVLSREDGSWSFNDISRDGDIALLEQGISVSESYLYTIHVASGALTPINRQEGQKIAYLGGILSPDGRYVYAGSNEGREFMTLTRYDLKSGEKTLISGDINWDLENFDLSPDGKTIAFAVNANGASVIHIRRTADNKPLKAPSLPAGEIGGMKFSPDGKRLGFGFASASSAGDAWAFELASGKLVRWTESELGGLNAETFIEPQLMTYKSFDGLDIPAFIYRPRGQGPFPVVITIHGGPEAQERPSFSPLWQYWLNELGVAVVVPNVRGSTGYGKSFIELDNGMKRMDSVKDIGALLDWVAAQPDLNKDKVMVYGGSYGGFMVNAAMYTYPDRLAGGVSIVGISSFVTFLENTSGYRQDLRRVEYGDERIPEMRAFQEQIAPLNNTDKMTKPMFIIHGANDPRVPLSETEQLFAKVKANGGKPWLMVAMDEGHGFRKKSNRDAMNAAVALFFKQKLTGDAAGQ